MSKRWYFTVLLAVTMPACVQSVRTSAGKDVVAERLFFGRNLNGQQAVSDSAWSNFLSEVVTPRFPDGFTTWPASGQWRRADGHIEQEACYVLELVHPASAAADSHVVFIMTEYKRRFKQEAVLRIVLPARAAY